MTARPDLVVLAGDAAPVRQATREEAEARAVRIRRTLEVVADDLLDAYRARDYVALGYGTGQAGWEAYLRDRFGDLRFTLPTEQRRERLVLMHGAGLKTARPIAAVPGQGSKSLVATDLEALREAGVLKVESERVGIDGKTQRAPQPKPAPAPAATATTVDRIVAAAEALIAADKCPDGVTTLDLMGRLKWRQGPASAAQSRAVKRGRLVWAGTWRDGFAVYTVPLPALEQ